MPELQPYLRRIGFAGVPRVDLATLVEIHRRHLRAIAYENLDVQLGRPVTLDIDAIHRKLVGEGRGGWCYEMNGLLGWALETIGFPVTRLAAGVMRSVRGDSALGNHLALRVDVPGESVAWLADAGFGDGAFEPVPLSPGPFRQRGFGFSLEALGDGWWRFHNQPYGAARSFDFSLTPADPALLERQCRFLQTSPESPFTRVAVVQRHVDDGLALLRGRVFIRARPEASERREIADERDYTTVLREVFDLEPPDVAGLWQRVEYQHADYLAALASAGSSAAAD